MISTDCLDSACSDRPVPASQRLINLFDAAEDLGYAQLCLFEHATPGAVSSLRIWAELRGLCFETRSYTLPGGQTYFVSGVAAVRENGLLGAAIDVQHEVAR